MDPSIKKEAKLEMLIDTIRKMLHILGRKEEKHKVEVGVAYSKQPILFPWEEKTRSLQEKTQSLQDKNKKKKMHDE